MKNIFRIIISLVTVLIFTDINSQQITFEYNYKTIDDDRINDIFEDINGEIYFCGSHAPEHNLFNKSMIIVKLDKFGNESENTEVNVENKSIYAQQLLKNDSTGFIVTATSCDTLPNQTDIEFGLFNMDLDLNLTNNKQYVLNSDLRMAGSHSTILSDENIISFISTMTNNSPLPKSNLYLFDSTFDTIKTIFYPNESRIISHSHELSNNRLWTLNWPLFQYELLDKDFNIIETEKVPEFILPNYGISWYSDSSFYLLGHKSIQDYDFNIAFIKQFNPLDTSNYLYKYWRINDTIDYPATWNGIDSNNKDSVFIGATVNQYYYDPLYGNHQPSWFVIMQLDSLLNIRWERFYGGDAYYTMTNLIASHDGGCIVAGTRYDYLNTPEHMLDITILKLDYEGLITTVNEDNANKLSEAILFPNPGSSQLNVRIASQYSESTFELFELNGTKVLHKEFFEKHNILNTECLKSGSYIYQITNDKGLKESGTWIKK